MLHKVFIIFILVLSTAKSQADEPTYVISALATNKTSKEVFDFLNGSNLQFQSDQQYSKLEVLFRKKIKVDQISIESCSEAFQDGIDFYANFDENFKFVEGGKKIVTLFDPAKKKELELTSITLNFRRSTELCLKKLVLESGGIPIEIRAPQVFPAKIDVTYATTDFQNLFDSKLNSTMKVLSPDKGSTLNFKWASPADFDQVMIWAGDFTTDILYKSYPRAKDVSVQCDQRAKETFELKDEMIPQVLNLSHAASCKTLKLQFGKMFSGLKSQELHLSEMRFIKNSQIFIPEISSFENQTLKQMRSEFAKAKMLPVLERQLTSVETPRMSVFRIHVDGSFFLHGFDELAKENESFYILGQMTAAAVKQSRINLTLRGIKRSSTLEMDSLSCGRRCFQENDFSNEKYFFEQEIQLRKGRDGFYRIDTLTPKKLRRIDFTSIRFLLDHSL